jgi:hypothetical protein
VQVQLFQRHEYPPDREVNFCHRGQVPEHAEQASIVAQRRRRCRQSNFSLPRHGEETLSGRPANRMEI